MTLVAAHRQLVTARYVVNYPAHEPRASDPHYADFRAWKRLQRKLGRERCAWAAHVDDDSECDLSKPLEAHHGHIEFALLNAVNFKHLEHLYPGISTPGKAGVWIESDANLMLLCARHHRGVGSGAHDLRWADYEASYFVAGGTFGSVS